MLCTRNSHDSTSRSPASFPVDTVRAETPACEDLAHLNNAGCALPPLAVLDVQLDYLRLEATIGGYEAATECADDLEGFYTSTAKLLNCSPEEIALTRGASESWWRAFLSVPLNPGDRVLAGRHEFIASGLGLIQAKEAGIDVQFIPDDGNGLTDLEALEAMLDERVKLVCVTQLPMSNGLINPAAQIGSLVKQAGALYLLDSCQAVGQLHVDVEQLQCDFLTATGRKWLRGPRGTGFLYVRGSVMDSLRTPIMSDGMSATWLTPDSFEMMPSAKRFEFAEISYAGKLGLATAIDYALDLGFQAISERVQHLAQMLRGELSAIPGISVHDVGTTQSGIVTFNIASIEAAIVSRRANERGINVGAPPAQASLLDMQRTAVPSLVRASPHYYNTEEELEGLIAVCHELSSTS